MGFFSWQTADTRESIYNSYSPVPTRPVYLLQPEGAAPILEQSYEGYGTFGDVDAHQWLAEKNLTPEQLATMDDDAKRSAGIDLECNTPEKIKLPLKFSFDPTARYEMVGASPQCPDQGYFYDDGDGDCNGGDDD